MLNPEGRGADEHRLMSLSPINLLPVPRRSEAAQLFLDHRSTPLSRSHAVRFRAQVVVCWLGCGVLMLALVVPACSRLPRPVLLPADVSARELTHLGQVYQAQGKSEAAEQTFQQAVQLNPRYTPAWVELGNLYYLRAAYAQAEAVYKKVLTLDPRMAEIYNNLCWVYVQEHRNLNEAESLIQRALALDPTSRYLFLDTQAVIWMRQGKDEQALASLTDAIRMTPSAAHDALAEQYEHLAEVYGHLGREEEAQWAREQAAMARRSHR